MMKPSEGSEHSTTLGRGLADQLLLWAYTCVFLNPHMSAAEQVHRPLMILKTFVDRLLLKANTHVLPKRSTDG